MVNLQSASGLPIQFHNDEITFDSDLSVLGKVDIMIEHLRGELLNKSLTCPEKFSTRYLNIDQQNVLKNKNLRYDIFVLPANLAGIEYVKNKGMYNELVTSEHSFPELIEVLYGTATVLLQRPKIKPSNSTGWSSVNDMYNFERLDDVILITLQKGQKMVIPSGWGHMVVNTRQSTLVISKIRHVDEYMVRRFIPEQGAGYYLIRKNARREVVKNPKYKEVPHYKKGTVDGVLKMLGITPATPIFRQVLRKNERFTWLTNPGSVNWNRVISEYLA